MIILERNNLMTPEADLIIPGCNNLVSSKRRLGEAISVIRNLTMVISIFENNL